MIEVINQIEVNLSLAARTVLSKQLNGHCDCEANIKDVMHELKTVELPKPARKLLNIIIREYLS